MEKISLSGMRMVKTIWDSLSDLEKLEAAEKVCGKGHGNVFLVAMQDWFKILDTLEVWHSVFSSDR